jgi:cyclophilin family peptidyl-prolyl cis-trans isomerase
MNHPLRTLAVCLVGLCTVLPAQEGEKPKPQEPAKAAGQAPSKAQEALAKDPAIQAIDKFIAEQKIDKEAAAWRSRVPQPPKLAFDADTDYFWHIDTEVGPLKIRFFPDVAPMHVSSGIYLTRLGFYDGLTFHRIMPGFMAQGGDPNTVEADRRLWGSGGPGYRMHGEFKDKSHDKRGILSTANTGRAGTDGSQFFITFRNTSQLDGGYTIWGEVVDGTETLKELEAKGRSDNNGMLDTPVKIHKMTVSVAPKAKDDAKAKEAATPKSGEQAEPGKGR